MNKKTYTLFTAWFFAAVALCHGLRFIFNWEVLISNSWYVPLWCSGVAFIATVYLSYQGFKLSK